MPCSLTHYLVLRLITTMSERGKVRRAKRYRARTGTILLDEYSAIPLDGVLLS